MGIKIIHNYYNYFLSWKIVKNQIKTFLYEVSRANLKIHRKKDIIYSAYIFPFYQLVSVFLIHVLKKVGVGGWEILAM